MDREYVIKKTMDCHSSSGPFDLVSSSSQLRFILGAVYDAGFAEGRIASFEGTSSAKPTAQLDWNDHARRAPAEPRDTGQMIMWTEYDHKADYGSCVEFTRLQCRECGVPFLGDRRRTECAQCSRPIPKDED